MREIWCGGDKIGENESTVEPQIGDVLVLEVEGDIQPYEVTKVFNFFPHQGDPVRRLEVKFIGGIDI